MAKKNKKNIVEVAETIINQENIMDEAIETQEAVEVTETTEASTEVKEPTESRYKLLLDKIQMNMLKQALSSIPGTEAIVEQIDTRLTRKEHGEGRTKKEVIKAFMGAHMIPFKAERDVATGSLKADEKILSAMRRVLVVHSNVDEVRVKVWKSLRDLKQVKEGKAEFDEGMLNVVVGESWTRLHEAE